MILGSAFLVAGFSVVLALDFLDFLDFLGSGTGVGSSVLPAVEAADLEDDHLKRRV